MVCASTSRTEVWFWYKQASDYVALFVVEGAAAVEAGFRLAIVDRKGNTPLTNQELKDFLVINSFGELFGEDDIDRKRLEGNGDLNDSDGEVYDEGGELDDSAELEGDEDDEEDDVGEEDDEDLADGDD